MYGRLAALSKYFTTEERRVMSKNFEICKIVGLGSIFRKNETKKKTLVKNQLVSANWWV